MYIEYSIKHTVWEQQYYSSWSTGLVNTRSTGWIL